MKVSIITRHAIANYGSLLQSLATEKLFQKLGFETEIINYIPNDEKIDNLVDSYIENSKFWNKNFFVRKMYKVLQYKNIYKMNIRFNEYQKRYLNLSKYEYNSIEELKANKPIADIYCTGSDQDWGAIGCKNYDEAYFLSFLDKDDKAISYAASFGKDVICSELKQNLFYLTSKYLKILVREDSAVKILNDCGIKNARQVLDPTLLTNQEDWNNICLNKRLIPEDYILIYQLHHNKKLDKYAKKLSKKTGKKLIRINTSKYFKYKVGEFVYLPSLTQFLSYIKFADIVLTDSFHGTCFSIIYNKNFIDILPSVTGTRISSILKLFDLENRITSGDVFVLAFKSINYVEVNKKLFLEQQNSISALKNALEGCGVKNERK